MEEPLDAGGDFFVDYSPEVFMPLIEWLRDLRDAEPGQMVFAQPPHLRRTAYIRMMKALEFPLHLFRTAGIQATGLL